MWQRLGLIVIFCSLAGCAIYGVSQYQQRFGAPSAVERLVEYPAREAIHYLDTVKPIIESRCVVCHGCYDAPCQLKLSSPEGIDRGVSQQLVYDGTRLLAATPQRLFIDAQQTVEWRDRGFNPILNEFSQTPEANLAASVMYNSLLLKQAHPLPNVAVLGEEFDFGLDRSQSCASIENFDELAINKPHSGMPYGFPALSSSEFKTLEAWMRSGATMAHSPNPSAFELEQMARWEAFLNQDDLKAQLMARYIYEHWFLAHIYFGIEPTTQFFKLVRSSTPPGQPIKQIATTRPFDDPKVKRVYYRLWHDKTTILAKTHLPLALDDDKLARLYQQFLAPQYQVTQLPSYEAAIASNPFKSFEQLPTAAKYQFMLDEAQLIIMGFIKGPVCRGQVALNVINDHFWVFFVDPKQDGSDKMGAFLAQNQDVLTLPAQDESTVLPVASWFKYAQAQIRYLAAKTNLMNQVFADNSKLNLNLIWQGEGVNTNAALTIFRHFDSATVTKGLVGQPPKTAWVLDYALFERIHYLLVAGFDVYGNVGHQLNTRLYMDFLRIEGENNFLALLPEAKREKIRDFWYRNASLSLIRHFQEKHPFSQETGVVYKTDDPQAELYQKLQQHLKQVLDNSHALQSPEDPSILASIEQTTSQAVGFLPQVSFLLVKIDSEYRAFSMIRNNAHFNITSLLNEAAQRAYQEDSLTLAKGFIGDYPAVIWHVAKEELPNFISQLHSLKTEADYHQLKNRYAVRRTNKDFWQYSDLLHDVAKQYQGVEFGLFDYNRYENK
ncbi:fatty acid cis/trans isomerase [Pseudoalteromonas tunicata]|uniref:fatty acid cis/trans isomerase n=1 Tax=Pseudoalteromonas tunicata TaxID=314281 RepID=UPI00273FAAE1|nr:fatty acid cis/trans isomerase [Pseudoalteromonas tunicata]MDP5214634.1 fatty acid cis/trans isomerase [Pseudoalteromonas tunicata]